jgi:predicted permease
MITDQLWRAQYGGDLGVVGKSVVVGGRTFEIVGVLPPQFRFPYQTDALTGMGAPPDSVARTHDREYALIGKLRPGVSHASVRAEMRVIATQLSSVDKAYEGVQIEVRDEMLDRQGRAFLPVPSLFLGAGLFVLLIACANVANLFLARAAERRAEMAIRASMGASRWRMVRQTLSETLLLGGAAAAFGTAASSALVRLGLHFIPTSGFPAWFHVAIDLRVLAFAVGVTLLVTAAVGVMPAVEGTRIDLVSALKQGGDGGTAKSGIARASRRGIAVQLALAVSLFIGAALLVRSYQRIANVDLGYPADQIAVAQPFFDPMRYAELTSRVELADEVVRRAKELPGVSTAALHGSFWRLRSAAKPRSSDSPEMFDPRLIPDRDTTRAASVRRFPELFVVSDEYFSLMRLRMGVGRGFIPEDASGAAPVTVVSAQIARMLWPSGSPIGHLVQAGVHGDVLTVVGVVDDVRSFRGGGRGYSDEPIPTLYLSERQALTGYPKILATGRGDALALHARLVDLIHALDPPMQMFRDVTLASQLDPALMETRVFGGLVGVFAASALALSIIGIYGVIAFGVAQRTRELGIRLALGGTPREVMRMVVVDGLRFVGVGLVLGLLLSTALGRLEKSFLFGVSTLDPLAYAAVCALFGIVAIAACCWPALRISRIDPLIALRAE